MAPGLRRPLRSVTCPGHPTARWRRISSPRFPPPRGARRRGGGAPLTPAIARWMCAAHVRLEAGGPLTLRVARVDRDLDGPTPGAAARVHHHYSMECRSSPSGFLTFPHAQVSSASGFAIETMPARTRIAVGTSLRARGSHLALIDRANSLWRLWQRRPQLNTVTLLASWPAPPADPFDAMRMTRRTASVVASASTLCSNASPSRA